MAQRKPERWATRIGVILAVAGSAVGLGNFLRFPTQVAVYGGGAFMIPYFCALLFLGLPLMWIEWALGRYGGSLGRHSLPGIYHVITGRRWAKYLGALGIYIPFIIVVYYTYIESWTLGYGVYSLLGKFAGFSTRAQMGKALESYLGIAGKQDWTPTWTLGFLVITVGLNFAVVYRGISGGIEKLSRVAMPLLFLMAVALVVRVLTLRGVGVASPAEGLDFLWKPDFSKLGDAQVWLAAAGQIFFTLSLGLGAIITYASYVRRNEDIALAGLTSVSLNEFAEVMLGGSLAIPAAVVFFGAAETMRIAETGSSVQLGFLAMPVIFQQMPLGNLFGMLWFTSSVSLLQPLVAFFQDEFGWNRRRAAFVLLGMTSAYLVPLVLLMKHGFLDEMDFWAVNILLPLGALVEVIIFVFLVGVGRGWEELTRGAQIRLPRAYRYIMYVALAYLTVLFGAWVYQQGIPKLTMHGVPEEAKDYVRLCRAILGVVLLAMVAKVWVAWQWQRAGKVIPPTSASEEEAGLEEEHVP
jgi:SNF family Na+-dependent transporter